MDLKHIKTLILFLCSLVFFAIFAYNFKVVNLEFILDPHNYSLLLGLFYVLSISSSILGTIFMARYDRNTLVMFVVYLFFALVFGSVLMIPQNANYSWIFSLIVIAVFITTYGVSSHSTDTYVKIPFFRIIKNIQSIVAIGVSAIFAASFYFFTDLSIQNPTVKNFINNFSNTIVSESIKLTTKKETNQESSIIQRPELNFLQDYLEDMQVDPSKELQKQDLQNTLQLMQEGKAIPGTDSANTLDIQENILNEAKNKISEEISRMLETYKKPILIALSLMIFIYSRFILGLLGIISGILNYLIFKMLEYFGVFNREKETIEIERLFL